MAGVLTEEYFLRKITQHGGDLCRFFLLLNGSFVINIYYITLCQNESRHNSVKHRQDSFARYIFSSFNESVPTLVQSHPFQQKNLL